MSFLEISNVTKIYPNGTQAVHETSLSIEKGEFMVFVGPSGCGKSTLLRMVAGLEDISQGEISLDGKVINKIDPSERDVAMVFQNYALYPHMNVYNNLAYGLKNRGIDKTLIREKVIETAELLQISQFLDSKPSLLSGGQRQRVAMGRAIVRNPKIFLFDEPLSNLDALLRIKMRLEIKKLQREMGVTSIFVTHDQVEAMTLADRLAVINNGIIEQLGTPIEIYNNPQSIFVAGFIGSPQMNFLDAELKNNVLKTASFTIPNFISNFNGEVILGIRPEHFLPSNKGEINISVDLVERLGSDNLIYGEMNGKKDFCYRSPGNVSVNIGDKLTLNIVDNKFYVFDKITNKRIN
ncbi:MAG TPA: sn-glycerol-3-phosphate ABC transporter ATP-binding protein UgpC [Candidatus Lambdaproteobacteria bacterium]|jgi:sn-glycerol 3-phosphate transport system ATP-binding protein|nr:sn-glycerol-3-phosphate ABC transporter ATP-binding protein UgpC [Candidatus Lambdaproteobacteria bacterium]HIC41476.1 sn-glycerol-3-phosphate ABC transporter ATP-binding protein UgpC [Pelagibacterales bacterium]|tara:strand:+ start:3169 stop:4221 length:1053 start_codon:yes stop_codon:yes gene_type:complete